MQFQIEILSLVGPVINRKGKNAWNALEVAYKKDGKIEGKKIVDFNNPEVFKLVSQAKQGEVYNVTAEKINDFWQWTGFTRADGTTAPTAETAPSVGEGVKGSTVAESAPSGRSAGRVTGSNYETPEERAVKQRHIARQSCLGYAIDVTKHNFPKGADEDEVMKLAEIFVRFVYQTTQEEAVEGLKSMKDDIPY